MAGWPFMDEHVSAFTAVNWAGWMRWALWVLPTKSTSQDKKSIKQTSLLSSQKENNSTVPQWDWVGGLWRLEDFIRNRRKKEQKSYKMFLAIDLIPQSSGPLVPEENHLLMKPQIQLLLKPHWRDGYKIMVIERLIFENPQTSKMTLDSEKVSVKEKKKNKKNQRQKRNHQSHEEVTVEN